MISQKVGKHHFSSFRPRTLTRDKLHPESSYIKWFLLAGTPVFTGVTIFYQTVKSEAARISGVSWATVWNRMKKFGIDFRQEMID